MLRDRRRWGSVCLTLLLWGSSAGADTIYEYRTPTGTRLFTDRAQMPGHSLLSIRKGWTESAQTPSQARRALYDRLIHRAALAHQVEPALIKAVIHTESAFNPRAVSRAGAQGLMQLMPQTADFLKVTEPFDPRQNIDGGARYLAYLMARFDQLDLVLAAYNAGEGNVRRHGGIPPFDETRRYVRKVQDLLPVYRAEMGDALAAR